MLAKREDLDIIDKTLQHLLDQGPAINAHGSCEYRAENGNKCAVGLWISDEEYTISFEGTDVPGILLTDKPLKIIRANEMLFNRMQNAHDTGVRRMYDPENFVLGRPSRAVFFKTVKEMFAAIRHEYEDKAINESLCV